MHIPRTRTLTCFLVLALTPFLAGCGSKYQAYNSTMIRSGIASEQAPAWVQGHFPDRDNEVYFVGRGVAHNVLDERSTVQSARNDVLSQLAAMLASQVGGSVAISESDVSGGHQYLPKENAAQATASANALDLEIDMAAFAGDLRLRGTYFEQWKVRESPPAAFWDTDRVVTRYKCWVLMSIPEQRITQLIDEIRDKQRRHVERTVAWLEEDRARKIRHEEEERAWVKQQARWDRDDEVVYRDHGIDLDHIDRASGIIFRVKSK